MLNQIQSFSQSLGLDILIYMLRIYLRLKVSNSRAQASSLPLFAFIFAFNLPILPSLFSKTLLKSHGNAYHYDFFQTLPKAIG